MQVEKQVVMDLLQTKVEEGGVERERRVDLLVCVSWEVHYFELCVDTSAPKNTNVYCW